MNVYYRGGKIQDYERVEKWDEDWTIDSAPKIRKIGAYKFKLHYVMSLDNGLIYNCINDDIEICTECDGHGKSTCEQCDGTGEINCDYCEGEGTLQKMETKQEKENKEKARQKMLDLVRNQLPLELE